MAELIGFERGLSSLVGPKLDELPFVRDLRAVVALVTGGSSPEVARSFRVSRQRLERMATVAERDGLSAVVPTKDDPRPAFNMIRTLFIGRVTEEVFRTRYESRILASDLGWLDLRPARTEIDYSITQQSDALDVNVKNASEPFRMVEKLGFDPLDCVPLGIYKLLQARKTATTRGTPLLFAYLVDWGASDKVQRVVRGVLTAEEISAAEVLLHVAAYGQRKAQDVTIEAMFGRAKDELLEVANIADDFRVIGWKRAFDVLLDNFEERAPALTLPRAGWRGELGIFLRVSTELTPWEEVMGLLEGREVSEDGSRIRPIAERVDSGSL